MCVPKPGPGGEGNLSPDTGTLAGLRGSRGAQGGQDTSNPQSTKREKAVLLYDLVTVRVGDIYCTIHFTVLCLLYIQFMKYESEYSNFAQTISVFDYPTV